MKKTFSLILAVVLVASMFVPSLAVESTPSFSLEDIIENYKPHTEEEINAFKEELMKKGLLGDFIVPDLYTCIFVISKNPKTYYIDKREQNIYGDKTQIMGVTKNNGFAILELSDVNWDKLHIRYRQDSTLDFPYGYVENDYYTAESVQYLYLYLDLYSNDRLSQEFLDSLSYEDRINFLLDMYLNILDTDEAVGITSEMLLRGGKSGDANGDGKVNAIDVHTLKSYLAGWDTVIKTVNCDIDKNGKLNSKDNLYLKKIIVGG